jgi:ABC-type transport system involved in cytochrome c biogenesis permease subunit
MILAAVGVLPPAGRIIPGPTHGQVSALGVAAACFLAASIGAAWTVRGQRGPATRYWAWAWVGAGLAANVVLLLWRGEQLNGGWPLIHRFDTFLVLAGLMALVGLYADLRWRWELTGATFALVTCILELSALTGLADYHVAPGPQPAGPAFLVHVAAFILAAVCLAVAGVAGGTYLALHRRLKRPGGMMAASRYPSLEALERLNIRAAALGFPLLTIGLVLGMLQIWNLPNRSEWLLDAKVVSAVIVWLVYAALLHLQHLPNFRGTRVAWLSMLCTLGLLATFVMSNLAMTKHP